MLGFITNKKQCENENCFSYFFNVNYISLTKFYLGKINTLYNFSSLTWYELQLAMKNNVDWWYHQFIITTPQLHSTKPEPRFCAGSNPACGMSEIHEGENLWQWSWLEIRPNAFRRSAISQKQFIIIFIWPCDFLLKQYS